jgi:hypothetical protein
MGSDDFPLLGQPWVTYLVVFLCSADHAPFLRSGLKFPRTTGAVAVKDGPWATAKRRVVEGGGPRRQA